MPRKSYESQYKDHYPKATIERQKKYNGKIYYLVRKNKRDYMYSGCGDTKPKAWKDALENINF